MKDLSIFKKKKTFLLGILALLFLGFLAFFLASEPAWAKGTRLNFGFIPATQAGTPTLAEAKKEGNFFFQFWSNFRSFLSQRLSFLFGKIE